MLIESRGGEYVQRRSYWQLAEELERAMRRGERWYRAWKVTSFLLLLVVAAWLWSSLLPGYIRLLVGE